MNHSTKRRAVQCAAVALAAVAIVGFEAQQAAARTGFGISIGGRNVRLDIGTRPTATREYTYRHPAATRAPQSCDARPWPGYHRGWPDADRYDRYPGRNPYASYYRGHHPRYSPWHSQRSFDQHFGYYHGDLRRGHH